MPRSFRRLRRPVDHYRQRRVRFLIHHCVDQKPLPVARHGIGRKVILKSPGAELKERDSRVHLETLAASHRRRHQLSVSRVIEQLSPISPPAWMVAPAVRDLSLAAAVGEALHPDLKPASYI